MNYRQRHILIRKRRHFFHPAAAAAVMRIVHRDNDVCTQRSSARGLVFVAGHCAKAACVYHQNIGSEEHVLLRIRQEAAVVAHMNELEFAPLIICILFLPRRLP